MHDGQLAIDAELVRRLVAEQFPQWAALAVVPVASDATVNAIFRLGDGLAARLPVQPDARVHAAAQLRAEADALAAFGSVSPFPAPRVEAIGAPGAGYPMPWTVQTWLPGRTATPGDDADSLPLADDLTALLVALRAAPSDGRAFSGAGRGGDLRDHDDDVAARLAVSGALLDVAALGDRWRALRELPRRGPDVMTHGDLHPANLLVERSTGGTRLVGVLDAGGYGPADPALDLIAPWTLFDTTARERIRRTLGVEDAEWGRGAAWAFVQAVGLVAYYAESNPGMSALGRRMLERVMSDPFVRAL